MKNIIFIVGIVLAFIIICVAFFNTIIQLIGAFSAYLIWLAYFFAIGIIYEIIVRSYKIIRKIFK